MNDFEGERPDPFVSDDHGRGPTLDKALHDAIRKKEGTHGQVFHVDIFISVSNPHVGEYICRLS
jgi:hypothetical protein